MHLHHVILLGLAPLFAGCFPFILEADPNEQPSNQVDTGSPLAELDITVGPQGGEFVVGDLRITVPQDAFAESVTFTLAETQRVAPEPWVQLSPIWEFQGDLPVLLAPIALSLPFTPQPERNPYVAVPGDQYSGYDAITPTQYFGDRVEVSLSSFPEEVFVGDPGTMTQRITWSTQNVDLLFIVDDSGSMEARQTDLADQVPALLRQLDAMPVEWQLGAITTTADGATALSGSFGRLIELNGRRWAAWDDPTPTADIKARLTPGTNGSATEQALYPLGLAYTTERDAWNAGFFRDDAHLAIIFLSDEEEQSPPAARTAAQNLFTDEGPSGGVSALAIIATVGSSCIFGVTGQHYINFVTAFNGTGVDICAPNRWESALATLTSQLEPPGIALNATPDLNTLVVSMTDSTGNADLATTEWAYDADENAVHLTNIRPESGATITISYRQVTQ